MSLSKSFVEKQVTINKLLDNKRCFDLRDEIKNYIFGDVVYTLSRKKKDNLIKSLKNNLEYSYDTINGSLSPSRQSGQWALGYGYEVQFQAIQCVACGGFEFVNPPVLGNVAHRALCSCDGFADYYNEQAAMFNEPLQIYM